MAFAQRVAPRDVAAGGIGPSARAGTDVVLRPAASQHGPSAVDAARRMACRGEARVATARQDQRLETGPDAAAQPGKPPAGNQLQPDGEDIDQHECEPEIGHRDADLGGTHGDRVADADRGARPPKMPTGMAMAVDRKSAISARGRETTARSAIRSMTGRAE